MVIRVFHLLYIFILQTFHTTADVGKFYTMPEVVKKQYFQLGGFPKSFGEQTITFNENGIIIRKPALEIIDYMKKADYNKLPIKYVICIL